MGIGIAPAYPLHVNGAIRSETGLSLGGTAELQVDAPGTFGGHFFVDGKGHVGVNNAAPAAALDVVGNINTSGTPIGASLNVAGGGVINGGLSTSAGISAGAVISTGTELKIGSDPTMTAALRMFITADSLTNCLRPPTS